MELAFRHRIAMVKDPNRRKYPLADRYIEVVSEKLTGEVLLDEALKMISSTQERMSVGQWIDLMSGKKLSMPQYSSLSPYHHHPSIFTPQNPLVFCARRQC